MEESIDHIIETVIALEPGEGGDMRNLKITLSVRMSLDEGLGYLGGQRLAHERPDLLLPALELFSNASWYAMRRSRFDRAQYRSGFHEGYFDELAGLAQPLPPEPVTYLT